MSKYHCSIRLVIRISIISSVLITTGCARNGEFSKEGAYEILRGINKSQDTTIYDKSKEDVNYQEYERRRQSILIEEEK